MLDFVVGLKLSVHLKGHISIKEKFSFCENLPVSYQVIVYANIKERTGYKI